MDEIKGTNESTAWKIVRCHANMAPGREERAISAFEAILEDTCNSDEPAIRTDLAVLVAKQGDDSAVKQA